jgi:hypothetical protein
MCLLLEQGPCVAEVAPLQVSDFDLKAGGWSSLVMPRRYVEEAEIADKGMA